MKQKNGKIGEYMYSRGKKPIKICICCQSTEIHTENYNNPTSKCVDELRTKIYKLTNMG